MQGLNRDINCLSFKSLYFDEQRTFPIAAAPNLTGAWAVSFDKLGIVSFSEVCCKIVPLKYDKFDVKPNSSLAKAKGTVLKDMYAKTAKKAKRKPIS